MSRRNKVELAVSWWKSLCGAPFHLAADGTLLPWQSQMPEAPGNLVERYDFDSIRGLVLECERREAGIERLLNDLGVPPMHVVYEDFIGAYSETVRRVLRFLDLQYNADIPEPLLKPTADEVNKVWVSRYLHDVEAGS